MIETGCSVVENNSTEGVDDVENHNPVKRAHVNVPTNFKDTSTCQ